MSYIPVTPSRRSRKQQHFVTNKALRYGLESVLLISAWAFVLYLIQPFITTMICWQGYKLMEGKALPLTIVVGTLTGIDVLVSFSILVFLILFSWSQWNAWHYRRLS